jgi:hypothetical protein
MGPDYDPDILDIEEVFVDEDGDHPLPDDPDYPPWFCPSDFFETDWEVEDEI